MILLKGQGLGENDNAGSVYASGTLLSEEDAYDSSRRTDFCR